MINSIQSVPPQQKVTKYSENFLHHPIIIHKNPLTKHAGVLL